MGVSSTTNRIAYVGDGSTTSFSFPYYFFAKADLLVYSYDTVAGTPTLKVLNTDYTITGSVSAQGLYPSGGSVVYVTAPASTVRVVIIRSPAQVQNFALSQNGLLSSTALVQQLDYLTLLAQRLEDQVARSALQNDGMAATFTNTLPYTLSLNPSATLVVNASGNGWDVGPTVSTISGATTSAAAAAASATSAATSASNAATSETNASLSATNAATSAASASGSAASATAAAGSATSAATSATNAATSASGAATSATNAAASATSAGTSATNAATSATAAAGSATAAAGSATSAATSATNAAGSATAAAGSATSAATSLAALSSSTTPGAGLVSKWDANVNMSANNFIEGYTTTATAAGTTVLTVTSTNLQYFTGATTQTITLPVTSTLALGQQFMIVNLSSGALTVNSSGANLVQTMVGSSSCAVTCILTSGTTAASWSARYSASLSGVVPVASGGTGITALPTTPTASTYAAWDANSNMSAVNVNAGFTNTVNSGATTTLTNASTYYQVFSTGGAGNTVVLPVASTCVVGQSFCIYNPSGTGITVNSSGANLVQTMLTGSRMIVTCILASGTGAASWIVKYQTQLTAVPAAVTTTQWDARKCLTAQVFIPQSTTTATAAGTTTLDVNSTQHLYFTGVTTQTVVLATASVLVNGYNFYIYNLSTGVVTVQTSGANTVQAMAANTQLMITCVNTAGGTGTASWAWTYLPITGVVPSTKGDLPTFSTVPAKLGVGVNGLALLSDSTAATGLRWGSVGGGSKNYLSALTASTASGVANTGNGDFEQGATTGWSLGTATLTSAFPSGVPTFGSGASGNLAISAVSSSQLAGLYSLSYASSAATTAGNFVASSAFFIDTEDQAKVLTFKFAYSAFTNPANANWSGTSSNSFGVAIYDVTASAWIMPAGVWGMTQSTGVGTCTGTFQTTATSTQYRLVVFNANATSGAATVYFDDFTVSPQITPIGPALSDWVSFTPTGSWSSNSTYTGRWRRVGDVAQIQVQVAFSGLPVGGAGVNLPSGFVIDTTKLVTTTSGQIVLGYGGGGRGGAGQIFFVTYNNTTSVSTGFLNSTTLATYSNPGPSSPGSWANGDVINFIFEVPIVGWSSNVQMSSDSDTRVVSLSASNNAGSATANTAISGWSITKDTHGSFVTGGTYTVPVSGDYVATFMAATTSGTPLAQIYKNGSLFAKGVGSGVRSIATVILPGLIAGDLITPRLDTTLTLTSTATDTLFSINRLSGPAVVAVSESVNARYFATATSISGSLATISWTTKDFDTHNAMSSGTYTIPVTGKYLVAANLALTASSSAAGNAVDLQIQKNGTVVSETAPTYQGVQVLLPLFLADTINCVAGDTIRVQASSAATTPSVTSSNSKNYMSIERVGN